MQPKKSLRRFIMQKKKAPPERKQKRIAQRILFFSLFAAGAVSAVGFGMFATFAYNFSKPLYISPLSSIKEAQASQNDSKWVQLKVELKKKGIEYKEMRKEKDLGYVVKLKDDSEVTFSSQKDIIAQIASLQYILSHLTMEGKLFSRLDLRFEKPVIVLKK